MSATLISPIGQEARPSLADLSRWLRRGWALFRAAPVRGCLLALLPIVFEALIQAIPVAGILLSKLLVPLASTWVLALLHRRATSGSWRMRSATERWRQRLPALLRLAVVLSVVVFGFQMLVLAALAGTEQAMAVTLREFGALQLSRWQVAGMLVSGLLPAIVLMFVPGQVLFSGRSVVQAFSESVCALVRYRVSVLALAALTAAVLASVAWMPVVLLLYLPFGLYVGYAAWEDVFTRGAVDGAG